MGRKYLCRDLVPVYVNKSTPFFFKGHGFQLLTHSLDYPITTEVENISGNPGLFPATFLPSDSGLFPVSFLTKFLVVVVVVALLFYVHGKHLRSCRDGQLT